MQNKFEEAGIKPGDRVKYENIEMTVDSCWEKKETIGGLFERVPALCCHYITSAGFNNIVIQENQFERVEKCQI